MIEFNPIILNVVIGATILAITSSIVGVFAFLQKKTLVGDAISHAILPGVCLAFMLTNSKNPIYLFAGAFASGWFGSFLIEFISSKSRIKKDSSISIILSLFFGIGMTLLSYIQNHDYSDKSGLNHYLFGSITSITTSDIYLFTSVSLITLFVIYFLFKEFRLVSFDPEFSNSIGINIKVINRVLTSLTVVAIVLGIKAAGVVLMAGMIITPAAIARFWTNKLIIMLNVAVIVAMFSCFFGSYLSYISPTPTGPWIVIVMSFIAILSFFFAPKKGIVFRKIKQIQFRNKIIEENILKALYQIGEKANNFNMSLSIEDILIRRSFLLIELKSGLRRLTSQGYLEKNDQGYAFSPMGLQKGKRTTKLHRLWELYLTNYMKIAPDHVHDDAETIEHIITPELELKLEELLQYPVRDPHDSIIPYK
ncbi:MAG: metal ABC transporter permease [Saprospiraceae bacterium]|nr:metal ABC transporter permease [Saprospiraceae bacterium]